MCFIQKINNDKRQKKLKSEYQTIKRTESECQNKSEFKNQNDQNQNIITNQNTEISQKT